MPAEKEQTVIFDLTEQKNKQLYCLSAKENDKTFDTNVFYTTIVLFDQL